MAIINRPRIIILIASVAALAISVSATDHIVGGDKGWTPGVDHQKWVYNQVIHVGDKLIFKYPPGKYNVLKVHEGSWEACLVSEPAEKTYNSGNDVITIETPGHHFFICGTKNDKGELLCEVAQMKFWIYVLPRSVSSSGRAPPSASKEYVVGDDKGWTLDVDYQAWAKGKQFNIGDKLIFKYTKGKHNVYQAIDETSFKECTIPPAQEALTSGNDIVTLKAPDNWFICGAGNHCQMGQKLYVHASEKSSGLKGGRKLVPPK